MYTDNPSAAEGQTNLFDVVVLSTFLRINGCGLDVIRGTQPAINKNIKKRQKNIHMLMCSEWKGDACTWPRLIVEDNPESLDRVLH